MLRVRGTKPEMIAMGIIDLRKFGDHYLKLRHIHAVSYTHLDVYKRQWLHCGYRGDRTEEVSDRAWHTSSVFHL